MRRYVVIQQVWRMSLGLVKYYLASNAKKIGFIVNKGILH